LLLFSIPSIGQLIQVWFGGESGHFRTPDAPILSELICGSFSSENATNIDRAGRILIEHHC
jgi:hypothetical protein